MECLIDRQQVFEKSTSSVVVSIRLPGVFVDRNEFVDPLYVDLLAGDGLHGEGGVVELRHGSLPATSARRAQVGGGARGDRVLLWPVTPDRGCRVALVTLDPTHVPAVGSHLVGVAVIRTAPLSPGQNLLLELPDRDVVVVRAFAVVIHDPGNDQGDLILGDQIGIKQPDVFVGPPVQDLARRDLRLRVTQARSQEKGSDRRNE